MRYRVDEAVASTPVSTSDTALLLTGVLGLVIGVILTWAGWHGRQMWLVVWCGGLVISSAAYIGWLLLGAG
jgi:hypothetical protein